MRRPPCPFSSARAGAVHVVVRRRGAGALDPDAQRAAHPVGRRGALMPDAHQGYGLPIGGVLATDGTVIPYAVGVDIACRMKLSVLDLPASLIERTRNALERALCGDAVRQRRQARAQPTATCSTPTLVDAAPALAPAQGGRSARHLRLGQPLRRVRHAHASRARSRPGRRGVPRPALALRQPRHRRADRRPLLEARARAHPELPKELSFLAWLDLDHEAGAEYWDAMNLMGEYASRNHDVIHERVVRALRTSVLAGVENHHNFAWKERHGDARSSSTARARRRPARACSASSPVRWRRPASSSAGAAARRASSRRRTAPAG